MLFGPDGRFVAETKAAPILDFRLRWSGGVVGGLERPAEFAPIGGLGNGVGPGVGVHGGNGLPTPGRLP